MDVARMIDILERSKHEHYTERSGLNDCDSVSTRPGPKPPCTCGADEINREIDEVIAELKKIGDALLAEPLDSALREITGNQCVAGCDIKSGLPLYRGRDGMMYCVGVIAPTNLDEKFPQYRMAATVDVQKGNSIWLPI